MRMQAAGVTSDSGSSSKAGLIAGLTLMCVVLVAVVVGGVWAVKSGKFGKRHNTDQYVAEDNGALSSPPRSV